MKSFHRQSDSAKIKQACHGQLLGVLLCIFRQHQVLMSYGYPKEDVDI